VAGAVVLQGRPLAQALNARTRAAVDDARARGLQPRVVDVIASNDPGAASYVRSKEKSAAALGITLDVRVFEPDTTQKTLDAALRQASADPSVHGIIVEFPLAKGLDADETLASIVAAKDVDGLTAENLGLLLSGREAAALASATAQSCIALAEEAGGVAGKRVVIVGRGRTVGRPLIPLVVNRHGTVTVCHSKTPALPDVVRSGDVVMVAIGRAGMIGREHVRAGQVVIDAGINVVDGGLRGDVDAAAIEPIVAAYTPVPGGVGTLTTAYLFHNVMQAMRLQGLIA
jgi:methylenetetrahydrofolate dehydrogenase (NADP+)/methenyltetrahydrofolate cyclohydrolase